MLFRSTSAHCRSTSRAFLVRASSLAFFVVEQNTAVLGAVLLILFDHFKGEAAFFTKTQIEFLKIKVDLVLCVPDYDLWRKPALDCFDYFFHSAIV